MSWRKARKLLLLVVVAAAAYYVYQTRPTMSGFIDSLLRPIFRNKQVVEESEHNRVVAEAAPAIGQDQPVSVEMLHEKMTMSEVRDLIGSPDQVDSYREEGIEKVRWTYRRLSRVLVFENGRVVSITVQ